MAEKGEAWWRGVLDGGDPTPRRFRDILRLIPSDPRCKMCNAPFGGVGGPLMRAVGKGRWDKNPRYCAACFNTLRRHPGGAEIEISMLFADVRGSSQLAERMAPSAFTAFLNRFFEVATRIVIASDGVVEKLIGDEVAALYLPGFAGPEHARVALGAARQLLRATGHHDASPWIPLGIGVHTGRAFVGNVGDATGVMEFTALGDAVNTTARLASAARPGEILASERLWHAVGGEESAEIRDLELKGKSEPVRVRVLS